MVWVESTSHRGISVKFFALLRNITSNLLHQIYFLVIVSQKRPFLRHCSAAILEAAPAFLLFDKTDSSSGRKDHGISGHINYLSAPA
jgi:hypothetical protein